MCIKQKPSKTSVLLTFCTAFLIIIIFAHSVMPAELSEEESANVLGILDIFLQKLNLDITFTSYFIRKTAHFVEYFLLGLSVTCTFWSYAKSIGRIVLPSLYTTLLVPMIDETIQYFSPGRSAEVRDILLDYSGASIAILSTIIIICVYVNKRKK